jgi:hypothetical protein
MEKRPLPSSQLCDGVLPSRKAKIGMANTVVSTIFILGPRLSAGTVLHLLIFRTVSTKLFI